MGISDNKKNGIEIAKNDSKYKVKNRLESWKKNAPMYSDQHLAKLKQIMHLVFTEEKPIFETDKDKRIYVDSTRKRSHYSDDIRRGLAIELAIIGNYYNLMTNCSSSIREHFATDIIQDVFFKMTWKRLASIDEILPFFAEASPDAFLNEIISLTRKQTIIKQLEKDESEIWFNRESHFVGLSRALETLAWEPEHLPTVISVAASLSILDEGNSNVHPRPKDIFAGIFWPWKPQTIASDDKLIASANLLSLQNKELAWKILSDSIERQMGFYHRIPKVRKHHDVEYNPECPTDIQRGNRLIHGYTNILLDIVESDVSFAPHLVQYFHLFKGAIDLERALQVLSSETLQSKTDEFKEPIWTGLQKFCIRNRVYKKMNWALSEDKLKTIDAVIELIKPESLIYQVKHLFDNSISDWYESKEYKNEEKRFNSMRIDSVKTIYAQARLNGIVELSQLVNNPTLLGGYVSISGIKFDNDTIASLLDDQKEKTKGFIYGYLSQSYDQWRDEWLSSFKKVSWSVTQRVSFMICLPLFDSVCHFAETWLGENESLFWKSYQHQYVSQKGADHAFVIHKALKYNRPDIAVNVFSCLHFEKENIDFDSCAKALIELAKTNLLKKIKHWDITQLIVDLQSMQKSDKQKKQLMQVEFFYLPLLDSTLHKGLSPATLYSALAEDPKFFHQVITYAYNSEMPEKNIEVNDDLRKNAFTLMFQWNIMPGVVNETLNYDAFMKWYKKAVKMCKESGHLHVAQTHIGETLYQAPKDPDGFWINKRIAALLDKKENDALRSGYHCAAFNSRGVRFVDFTGKRERDAAEEQNKKADELEKEGFTNFAKVFRDLARIYEKEAESAIKDGERFKNQDTDEL